MKLSISIPPSELTKAKADIARFQRIIQASIAQILYRGGDRIDSKTKRRCPVDTGRLRSSYRFQVDRSKLSLVNGTNVQYALPVEVGTVGQRAQPHLVPSANAEYPKILEAIRKEVSHAT